jgi:hypothetical protein
LLSSQEELLFKTHVSYKRVLDFLVYQHFQYFEIYQNSDFDFDFEQLKIKVILKLDFGLHILPHHHRLDPHLHSNQDFQHPLPVHQIVVSPNHLKNNLDLNPFLHHHFSYCQTYIRQCHPYQ